MTTPRPSAGPRIRYTVTAICPDRATADDFVAWLAGGHIAAVMAGGATHARVVRLDADEPTPETIVIEYVFPDRPTFDLYLRDHAPALRAEGVTAFVEQRGVRMSRTIGAIAHEAP
jgi:hypothetical protein